MGVQRFGIVGRMLILEKGSNFQRCFVDVLNV